MSGIKKNDQQQTNYLYAVRDVTLLLSDHDWHKTAEVTKICKRYKIKYDQICDIVPIAEDYGYVCWTSDTTPTESPKSRKI